MEETRIELKKKRNMVRHEWISLESKEALNFEFKTINFYQISSENNLGSDNRRKKKFKLSPQSKKSKTAPQAIPKQVSFLSIPHYKTFSLCLYP